MRVNIHRELIVLLLVMKRVQQEQQLIILLLSVLLQVIQDKVRKLLPLEDKQVRIIRVRMLLLLVSKQDILDNRLML